jgi:hypothetical protein
LAGATGNDTGRAPTKTASTASTVALDVSSPVSGSVVSAEDITVHGTVTPSDASVEIQGRSAPAGSGAFAGNVTIHNGINTIDIIASAPGLAPASTTITVTGQISASNSSASSREPSGGATGGEGETFHAPDGNIACSIGSEGARCSVASANVTFVLPAGGGSAYIAQGQLVAKGIGPEAPFASSRSNGAITCTIPAENIPAGLTCRNGTTGHGFEASRDAARQLAY